MDILLINKVHGEDVVIKFLIRNLALSTIITVSFSSGAYAWTDITSLVRSKTDLDDRIRNACHRNCQGNRRQGDLISIHIRKTGSNTFDVRAKAYAKNHHHIDPPKVFGRSIGGGAAAYIWTVNIDALGVLNTSDCMITYTSINVSGDQLGIVRDAARKKVNTREKIDNCNDLLTGF